MMKHSEWMKRTAVSMSRRSTELKAVDDSLAEYEKHPGNLSKFLGLLRNLEIWKKSKKDWTRSQRNQNGAVYELNKEIQLSPIYQQELKILANAERDAIKQLFSNKKFESALDWKGHLKSVAKGALYTIGADYSVGQIQNGVQGKSNPTSPGPAVTALLRAAFGKDGSDADMIAEVTSILGTGFVADFAAKAMPFIGMAYSGYRVVEYWGTVSKRQYDKYQLECGRDAIRPGNAQAAIDAIKRKLQREQNECARRAVMQSTEFACRVAAPPGVGSIVSGINGLGQLGETIYQIGRDYRDKRAANNAMKNDFTVNATIFNINPILGCYYMVSCTRSNVLNFLFTDMGVEGWLTEVERLNEQITPIIDSARRIIGNSRYIISDMPMIALKEQPGTKAQQKQFSKEYKYNTGGRLYRLFHFDPKA